MYRLSDDCGHFTHLRYRELLIFLEIILLYSRTLIQMIFPLSYLFTPCGIPPLWQTTDVLHETAPHWPPQHTKLRILWLRLNINLCHSHASADSQTHSRVFCGEFRTNFAKYFKPEEFYYCRPAGLWWPTCSCIQIDLTEFLQWKVIQEISLF